MNNDYERRSFWTNELYRFKNIVEFVEETAVIYDNELSYQKEKDYLLKRNLLKDDSLSK